MLIEQNCLRPNNNILGIMSDFISVIIRYQGIHHVTRNVIESIIKI
jgi:hypothetical protein